MGEHCCTGGKTSGDASNVAGPCERGTHLKHTVVRLLIDCAWPVPNFAALAKLDPLDLAGRARHLCTAVRGTRRFRKKLCQLCLSLGVLAAPVGGRALAEHACPSGRQCEAAQTRGRDAQHEEAGRVPRPDKLACFVRSRDSQRMQKGFACGWPPVRHIQQTAACGRNAMAAEPPGRASSSSCVIAPRVVLRCTLQSTCTCGCRRHPPPPGPGLGRPAVGHTDCYTSRPGCTSGASGAGANTADTGHRMMFSALRTTTSA